jgi:hypothetical protein
VGGESGKAVETARLNVGLLGEVDNVEEVMGERRRIESKERDGMSGVFGLRWEEGGSLRGEREGVEGLAVVFVWGVKTTGRDRGGEPTELFDKDGDRDRLGKVVVRAVEVDWCRSEGGSFAMVFAFIRLAAITAATLLFFVCGVDCVDPDNKVGSGHAFSSCFRAVESSPAIIAVPLSLHTAFSNQ